VQVVRSNQVWALDTTYIPMRKGFVYLTAVVDVASRKVLAHKVSITLEACHAVEILEQAFKRYGQPEIVNTDQGSQFTAQEFVDAVHSKEGCKLSMDGKGAWRENKQSAVSAQTNICPQGMLCSSYNVFVERLWRTVKYERVYLKAYDSVAQAKADIAQYMAWYNANRGHSSLGCKTPDLQYASRLPKLKEAA
jgi:putative transposase